MAQCAHASKNNDSLEAMDTQKADLYQEYTAN